MDRVRVNPQRTRRPSDPASIQAAPSQASAGQGIQASDPATQKRGGAHHARQLPAAPAAINLSSKAPGSRGCPCLTDGVLTPAALVHAQSQTLNPLRLRLRLRLDQATRKQVGKQTRLRYRRYRIPHTAPSPVLSETLSLAVTRDHRSVLLSLLPVHPSLPRSLHPSHSFRTVHPSTSSISPANKPGRTARQPESHTTISHPPNQHACSRLALLPSLPLPTSTSALPLSPPLSGCPPPSLLLPL